MSKARLAQRRKNKKHSNSDDSRSHSSLSSNSSGCSFSSGNSSLTSGTSSMKTPKVSRSDSSFGLTPKKEKNVFDFGTDKVNAYLSSISDSSDESSQGSASYLSSPYHCPVSVPVLPTGKLSSPLALLPLPKENRHQRSAISSKSSSSQDSFILTGPQTRAQKRKLDSILEKESHTAGGNIATSRIIHSKRVRKKRGPTIVIDD